ncbi:transposase [Desulfonatronospira thiodismutans]|uniref:transposase n=1 Tax=Desulfonatronospira thiodismutans TaxID=488939 RepID=UPI00031453B4
MEARRHAFQEDQKLINLFKQRAGGEAGFSQLKVHHGLRRLRCLGSVKSKFKIIMAVTALNIKRTFNWMKGGSSGPRTRKNKDFEPDTGILLFFIWLFCSYLRKTLIASGLRPKIFS